MKRILVILGELKLKFQGRHTMVCSCVHGPADPFWHVPFVLWVYGHGLTRLGHNLHAGILPFQAPEYPAEEADSGDFGGAQVSEPTHHGVYLCPWAC